MRRFGSIFTLLSLFAALGCARKVEGNQEVTVTVKPGARQSWQGLGFGPPGHNGNFLSQASHEKVANMIWGTLGATQARLFLYGLNTPGPGIAPSVAPWVNNMMPPNGYQWEAMLKAGVTDRILCLFDIPTYDSSPATAVPWSLTGNGRGPASSDGISDFCNLMVSALDQFRKAGMVFNWVEVVNEPSIGTSKRPTIAPAQWPVVVDRLRETLDERGYRLDGSGPYQAVDIMGPSCSQANVASPYPNTMGAILKAMASDVRCWGDAAHRGSLGRISYHSYGVALSEEIQRLFTANGRTIPVECTEASDWGSSVVDSVQEGAGDWYSATGMTARLLNDLNWGASYWMGFNSYQNNLSCTLLVTTLSDSEWVVQQKYYALKLIHSVLEKNATARNVSSSLDGTLDWAGKRKAHLYPAVLKNPDGTWAILLQNHTSSNFGAAGASAMLRFYGIDTNEMRNAVTRNGGPDQDETYDVTVDLSSELGHSASGTFNVYKMGPPPYSLSASYRKGDVVQFNGIIYACQSPNTGSPPSKLNPSWSVTSIDTTGKLFETVKMSGGTVKVPNVGPLDLFVLKSTTPL